MNYSKRIIGPTILTLVFSFFAPVGRAKVELGVVDDKNILEFRPDAMVDDFLDLFYHAESPTKSSHKPLLKVFDWTKKLVQDQDIGHTASEHQEIRTLLLTQAQAVEDSNFEYGKFIDFIYKALRFRELFNDVAIEATAIGEPKLKITTFSSQDNYLVDRSLYAGDLRSMLNNSLPIVAPFTGSMTKRQFNFWVGLPIVFSGIREVPIEADGRVMLQAEFFGHDAIPHGGIVLSASAWSMLTESDLKNRRTTKKVLMSLMSNYHVFLTSVENLQEESLKKAIHDLVFEMTHEYNSKPEFSFFDSTIYNRLGSQLDKVLSRARSLDKTFNDKIYDRAKEWIIDRWMTSNCGKQLNP